MHASTKGKTLTHYHLYRLGDPSGEDMRVALEDSGRRSFHGRWAFLKAATALDDAIFKQGFDPFHRQQGQVIGVNEHHPELWALKDQYGDAAAALVMAKKQELEGVPWGSNHATVASLSTCSLLSVKVGFAVFSSKEPYGVVASIHLLPFFFVCLLVT